MYQNEKVDMRVKYTREWTFEALYRLLKIKKYDEIKISEIIKRAGISRATFYRNFSSKDDIIKIKVRTFFESFFVSIFELAEYEKSDDEMVLIHKFFKRVDEEEKLMDTVIQTKLEYLMVSGILELISIRRSQLYQIVTTNEIVEKYTVEIVASSAWTLLSRWHRSGKIESPSELSQIYSSAFNSVYIALFGDKSEL
ncbi:MAG: TetR/AcrR family transcriptional regulator [Candidatus Izimaplasma sp.]|nr:TetR/AcrR family transcriptional regulator [Candidatus Izimaplasma bacterium]